MDLSLVAIMTAKVVRTKNLFIHTLAVTYLNDFNFDDN